MNLYILGNGGFAHEVFDHIYLKENTNKFYGFITLIGDKAFVISEQGIVPFEYDKEASFIVGTQNTIWKNKLLQYFLNLYEPVKTYSAGMRARLAFALSMVIDFDCFLIDEVVAVGDRRFHEKCHIELFEKRKDRAMIIVSHDSGYVREHCDNAAVLKNGNLHQFDNMEEAFCFYQSSVNL